MKTREKTILLGIIRLFFGPCIKSTVNVNVIGGVGRGRGGFFDLFRFTGYCLLPKILIDKSPYNVLVFFTTNVQIL